MSRRDEKRWTNDYEHRETPEQMAMHGLFPGKLLYVAAITSLFVIFVGLTLLAVGAFG